MGPSHAPNLVQSNTREQKTSSLWAPDLSPRNGQSPLRSVLQLAKANLHRDMFVASSPASSIESRMHLEQDDQSLAPLPVDRVVDSNSDTEVTSWRYSTAPQYVATPVNDVREPLPSPTLPDPLPATNIDCEIYSPTEPISSGFESPHLTYNRRTTYMDAVEMALPLSLPSSPINKRRDVSSIGPGVFENRTALETSMEELRVSDTVGTGSSLEESPIVTRARQNSRDRASISPLPDSPEKIIFLSESAEAAAESAKAKRRLLKDAFKTDQSYIHDAEMDSETHNYDPRCRSDFDAYNFQRSGLKTHSLTPCPDPSAHLTRSTRLERPSSTASTDVLATGHDLALGQIYPPQIVSRATATGSPMPFPRQRLRPPTAQSDPYAGYADSVRHPRHGNVARGYVNPNFFYPRGSSRPLAQPDYAFSTAASKVYGSSQAPDQRIRDSYKTDTLTALERPPSRYRKNGIGAEVVPRGVGRYYQRPPSSMRPSSARSRPSSRRTYHGESDVRFRSSPPRAPGSESFIPSNRKRAVDDSFLAIDGQVEHINWEATALKHRSSEIMQLDDETSAAVRMSIFGSNTPEALHQARQGLRELSPNVQIYRKDRQENVHLRKKRRPSYWDNDLKEIRESPAGRGGVNSPVSAQASMRAEFEIASLGNTEMDVDDQHLATEGDCVYNELSNTMTEA